MWLWMLVSSKFSGQASRLPGDPGKSCYCSSSLKTLWGRISCSWRNLSLFVTRPSTDWARPTHIVESNLLYSKSTDLNVNLIFLKNAFTVTCGLTFDQISGYRGLATLTHKTNHDRGHFSAPDKMHWESYPRHRQGKCRWGDGCECCWGSRIDSTEWEIHV